MASRQLYVGTVGTLLVFLDGLIRSSDHAARQYEEGEPDEEGVATLVPVFRPEPWAEGGIEETTLVLLDALFQQGSDNPALATHPSQKRTYKGLLKSAEPYRA